MPKGWKVSVTTGREGRKASILIDHLGHSANINLDENIFNSKNVPEGCKTFMFFHEIGHLVYGPDENACDKYAFLHSLRAGVSPFLCYVAIRHFMPEHYNDRIIDMGKNLLEYEHLKDF